MVTGFFLKDITDPCGRKLVLKLKSDGKKDKSKKKYWKEHPEEDPRIKAKTIGLDEVKMVPMGPPSGMLFYFDPINKI